VGENLEEKEFMKGGSEKSFVETTGKTEREPRDLNE
jgi:hypothetical protein